MNAAHLIDLPEEERTVAVTLQLILRETGLGFRQSGKTIVLYPENRQNNLPVNQTKVTVRGTVTDEKGEPLPGAVVMPKEESGINGTVTDLDGKFILSDLPAD